MPKKKLHRFKVVEIRARRVEYLVEAEDEGSASRLDGKILEENGDADDYGLEHVSTTQVADDCESLDA